MHIGGIYDKNPSRREKWVVGISEGAPNGENQGWIGSVPVESAITVLTPREKSWLESKL